MEKDLWYGNQPMNDMKENGKITSNGDLELISGNKKEAIISFLEIDMLVTGREECATSKAHSSTRMAANMKENGEIT